jgi:hypothetical protein
MKYILHFKSEVYTDFLKSIYSTKWGTFISDGYVYIHLAACCSCSCRPPVCTQCVLDRTRQRSTREPGASMSVHEIVVPSRACSCSTAVCHRFFVVVVIRRTHLTYAVRRLVEPPSVSCISSPWSPRWATVSRMHVVSVDNRQPSLVEKRPSIPVCKGH